MVYYTRDGIMCEVCRKLVLWKDCFEMQCIACNRKRDTFDATKKYINDNSSPRAMEEFVQACHFIQQAFGEEIKWTFADMLPEKPNMADISATAQMICESAGNSSKN